MLNIIVVNDFAFVNGGAAQVALESAIALSHRGHAVTFFSAVGPATDQLLRSSVKVEIVGQHDVRTDPNRLRAVAQGVWNELAGNRLAAMLSDLDPSATIIHVHGWIKALSSSIVRVALKGNFPVVTTLHDYFYACPAGGFYNFRSRTICKLKPLSISCILENCDRDSYSHKLWRVSRQLTQNSLGRMRRLNHFILLSDTSQAVLEPLLPAHAHLYRIPNPIGIDKDTPVDVSSNFRFVTVGRLSLEKGIELFAEAASEIGCSIVCVGEGPSRYRVSSVCPAAEITGWQTRHEVIEHLKSARAIVFPSVWYEAQPLAVLEAAALGVPAIVSDICAAKEAVVDGVTGLWFRSGDVADLKAKMKRMIQGREAAQMGKAAYERYWGNPQTVQRHVNQLEDCYSRVLETTTNGFKKYEHLQLA